MRRLVATTALVGGLAISACGADDDSADATLTVTLWGENAAVTGFAFPPVSANDPVFVDGWDLRFDRILVTVDDITLSDGPDTNPTDQSQTGPVLATAKGPWAVDVTKPGVPTQITPKGSLVNVMTADPNADGKDPNAQTLTQFTSLGGQSFDTSARYAFGFSFVTASNSAELTNLDADAKADYRDMVEKGVTVLYVGTATFNGTSCTSSDPTYDFTKLPSSVSFRLEFKSPANYGNCQNTDLHGKAFDGEEAQRGVQVTADGTTTAQVTIHVDHPFWNTVDHDAAELFFDQMAAAASPDGALTLSDSTKLDFTSFKDASGKALPWRSCVAASPVKSGVRRFDSGSVPVDPSGSPASALRNYADFVVYEQSTQGHLNADGLCAVERQFPAPR